ncbi:MAG TPA: hypothetical protein VJM49_01445 [Acidimicrobiales bacterium]|nr:hypothetical protein [Acidimicrobiales bacterium]
MVLGARRTRALLVASALVGGALVGCGGDDDEPVSDLESGASSDETTTTAAADDDEAAVVAAYEGMWQGLIAAGDPPDPESAALAEHATGEVLANFQDFLARNAAEGVALRGTYEFDARATSVSDETATVADCGLDQTQLVVIATGEVAEPFDQERDGVVADLVVEEGTWKVTTVRDDPSACT